MARCEDWPCCGHEAGCCPDYSDTGEQLNMKCVCGATLPLDNGCSICDACLRRMAIEDGELPEDDYDEDEDDEDTYEEDMDESMDGDFDSGMRDAGHGTDEDYGYYGGGEDY